MRPHQLPIAFCAVFALALPALALPKVELSTRRYDFGDRLPGVLPPASFPVTNRGDSPLILRPQLCCGLTIKGTESPIPPGVTRRIMVTAAHPLGEGLLRKSVRVLTNDPTSPEFEVEVVAMGKKPIQLFPGDELTFPLHAEVIPPQRVELRSNDEPELKITSIRSSAAYIRCKEVTARLPEGEQPGRHRAVEISVSPDAPATPYEAVVVIGTSCKRRPQVKLRVYGLSASAVTAQPPSLQFDPIPKGEESAIRLVMLTRAVGPFKVLGIATSDPRMSVKVQMDASGMFGELLAVFSPGKTRGPFRGTITIRTDDPERPRIVLAYAGEAG